MPEAPSLSYAIDHMNGACAIRFHGNLDAGTVPAIWKTLPSSIPRSNGTGALELHLDSVRFLDTSGAALLRRLILLAEGMGYASAQCHALQPEFRTLMTLAEEAETSAPQPPDDHRVPFIQRIGGAADTVIYETHEFISYIGEITRALAGSLKHPAGNRWKEIALISERTGVNALGIVSLVSFIVGLVMAFQAAIPMRMFGAELYVADLIGIAMVRELGPLMTAIVLAGRSASAFAAEIGTMRINEEIDALKVMGIEPVQFLIVPRIIAAALMTPLLTIFSNLVGMAGGAVVIISMGYPPISYYNQVVDFVQWGDFAGGMAKSFVFGILIAATGCIHGYQTRSGPSAVGQSTTRAVVTSIVLIAVSDGIFSVVFYFLGI